MMKRFKNILVFISDESMSTENPAVNRSIDLAQRNGAKVTLMDVVSPPEGMIAEFKGIFEAQELMEIVVKQRTQVLQEFATLYEGVDVEVNVAVGRDFIEIVRRMVLNKHDVLMKLANESTGSFDSSDFHLMRKCPQPVWLFKSKFKAKSRRALVAIDLNQASHEEGDKLNHVLMELATSLSDTDGCELHVLSCWQLYGEHALRHSPFVKLPAEKLENLLAKTKEENMSALRALVGKYQHNNVYMHLEKGDPVSIIPKFAKDRKIDTVVMGTLARSGIPGLLIGNTSESILSKIDTSVITVKPSGFESPVK